MNRNLIPNPSTKDFTITQLFLSQEEQKTWVDGMGLRTVPPGFRGFARWDGTSLKIGIEPAAGATADPPKKDRLDEYTDADLETEMGKKGIRKDKNDNRTTMLAKLRAKP